MKKVSLILTALALVLGISQCKKQENPVSGKIVTQKVTFTTSFGDGSKLGVNETSGTLNLTWAAGDKIDVYDDDELSNKVGGFECESTADEGKTGTFTGEITCADDAKLKFVFGTEPNYMSQHFTQITNGEIYLVGKSDFQESGEYDVNMNLPYAILKVDLTGLATETANDISVKIGEAEKAKITNVTTTNYKVYLLLPLENEEPAETKLTFSNGTKTIDMTFNIAANCFGTAGGTGGFAPVEPAAPAHEYVDLGLPDGTLWAKYNLGAEHPYDYGDYYAWGETETKSDYSWSTYKWGAWKQFTKYVTQAGFGMETPDNKTTLESGDDAATKAWGDDWRMPTMEEWQDLCGNTYQEWVYNYDNTGVPGFVVYKVKNEADKGLWKVDMFDNPDEPEWVVYNQDGDFAELTGWYSLSDAHLFFPLACYRSGTTFFLVGSNGYYWSSSLETSDPSCAYSMQFSSSTVKPDFYNVRHQGCSVRPVRDGR